MNNVCLLWKVIQKRYLKPTADKDSLKNLESNPRDLKQLKLNITHSIEEVNEITLRKVARSMVKRAIKCTKLNGHHFQHLL
jgi:hypothetical protein